MPCIKNQGRSAQCTAPLSVSQNYLTSPATIRNILKRTNITQYDHVIEIGPGKGHITRALLGRGGRVTAVELDGTLYQSLRERLGGNKNLQLVHQDFLKYQLPPGGTYKVFASIPFSRTTDILLKLTEFRNPPEEAWLVVEKGAAKRFMGTPRESVRSLMLKPYFDMDIAYYFQRADFHPMPGVDAVLLHLRKKAAPDIGIGQRRGYRRFIEAGLSGNGQQLGKLLGQKRLRRILGTGLMNDITPSHLLYVQWLCLFRCVTRE
jgi:23S rRNA (adenine-N6)-dimethyltransferase